MEREKEPIKTFLNYLIRMKNYLGLAIILILLFFIYLEFQPEKNPAKSGITTEAVATNSQKIVDYTASFAIFTHNSIRYFNDPKYHNLSSEVYIQADNPNIVHVKKNGLTWGAFFKTLPMDLAQYCLTTGSGQNYCTGQGGELKFYINGKKVPNILSLKIQAGDKLLISYGFETEDQILTQLEQVVDTIK